MKSLSFRDQVINKLHSGLFVLYFMPGCNSCKKQFEILGLPMRGSKRTLAMNNTIDCSSGQKPDSQYHFAPRYLDPSTLSAFPTWHNTQTGKILEGYHTPEQIMRKLVRYPIGGVNRSRGRRRKVSSTDPDWRSKIVRSRRRRASNRFGTDLPTASPIQLAPQPDYLTNYCGTGVNGGFRGGNALSPQQNLIGGLQAELNKYSNAGPFLGMNFGLGGPNFSLTPTRLINNGGARLPRPYGPSDNTLMKGPHWAGSLLQPVDLSLVGQFGRCRSLKRRSLKRRFGATPGTPGWPTRAASIGSEWVSPRLVAAKGYNLSPVLGFPPSFAANQELQEASTKYSINMPMQYSNNQFNNPQPPSKHTKFGASRPSLYYMEGPNNVGYQANMALYNGRNRFSNRRRFGGVMTLTNGRTSAGSLWERKNSFGAGANTINWLTGNTYRPSQNPRIIKVQPDPANPRAWLAGSKGIVRESSLPNGARRFTNLGIRGGRANNQFGMQLFYNTPNFSGMQAGPVIVEQPLPPRMQIETQIPEGAYVSYGKRRYKRRSVALRLPAKAHHKKPLKTNFGGKTITLTANNKLTIE